MRVLSLHNPPAFGADMLVHMEVVQAAGDDGAAETREAEEGQDPPVPVKGAVHRGQHLSPALRAGQGNCRVEIQWH